MVTTSHQAAAGGLDELDVLGDKRFIRSLPQLFEGGRRRKAPSIKGPVHPSNGVDLLSGHMQATHAHHVQAAGHVYGRQRKEGRHVVKGARGSGEHRAAADPAELVHRAVARQGRVVVDDRVTRQERAICQRAVVGDPCVVAGVGVEA